MGGFTHLSPLWHIGCYCSLEPGRAAPPKSGKLLSIKVVSRAGRTEAGVARHRAAC